MAQLNISSLGEPCQPDWTFNNVSMTCLKHITILSSNWSDAESECLSLGGHLVSITHEQKVNSIHAFTGVVASLSNAVFVGLNDIDNEGN